MPALRCWKIRSRYRSSRAFTLIELLATLAVLSILIGLMLPAVQSVRESSRRTSCHNNLRQVGLSALNFNGVHQHFPGNWFNAAADDRNYNRDRGLFVELLPHFGYDGLFERINSAPTVFAAINQDALMAVPPILTCPSAEPTATLVDIAERFSSPPVPGHTARTCDYVGNAGWRFTDNFSSAPSSSLARGPIGARVPGIKAGVTSTEVTSGLSNTILFWESLGSLIYYPRQSGGLDINVAAAHGFATVIDSERNVVWFSTGQASTKSYLHAWAGLRTGTTRSYNGQAINVTNWWRDPYSRHGGGANVALCDGSVSFITEHIDEMLFQRLVSMASWKSPSKWD